MLHKDSSPWYLLWVPVLQPLRGHQINSKRISTSGDNADVHGFSRLVCKSVHASLRLKFDTRLWDSMAEMTDPEAAFSGLKAHVLLWGSCWLFVSYSPTLAPCQIREEALPSCPYLALWLVHNTRSPFHKPTPAYKSFFPSIHHPSSVPSEFDLRLRLHAEWLTTDKGTDRMLIVYEDSQWWQGVLKPGW